MPARRRKPKFSAQKPHDFQDHARACVVADLNGRRIYVGVFKAGPKVYRAGCDHVAAPGETEHDSTQLDAYRRRFREALEAPGVGGRRLSKLCIETAVALISQPEKGLRAVADDEGVSPAAIVCRCRAIERHFPDFKKGWRQKKYYIRRRRS